MGQNKEILKNINENLNKYNVNNLKIKDLRVLFEKEANKSLSLMIKSKGKRKKIYKEIIQEFIKDKEELLKTLFIEENNLDDYIEKDFFDLFFNKKNILIKFFKDELNFEKEISSFNVKLKKEKRKDTSKKLIFKYLEEFYLNHPVRKIKRKFIFHAGPTNSGKSYGALKEFENGKKSCYLAPLRLLAWEVYDKFKDKLLISLITGEEKTIGDFDTHTSSTIEMANYQEEYEVGIIDEIQMIADPQRGWAWTKALLLLNAEKIYLCGDESALKVIKDILKITGDSLEVKHHKRKTPLELMKKPIGFTSLEKGDAIVTFSRKNIFLLKDILENEYNKKVSVIYGMLSPEVRKEEAERFVRGESDILIATDAIGMGLNLPIKRVFFSTLEKYYNKQSHILSISDIKQISGRAGRYGLHENGYFGLLDQAHNPSNKYRYNYTEEDIKHDNRYYLDLLKRSLNSKVPEKNYAILGPDYENLLAINDKLKEIRDDQEELSLLEFYYFFDELRYSNSFFIKADISNQIEQTELLNTFFNIKDLDPKDLFKFSVAPVLLKNEDNLDYFKDLSLGYYNEEEIKINKNLVNFTSDIQELEILYKNLDLYRWLKNQLEKGYLLNESMDNINKIKDQLNSKILKILLTS
jgi:ATP-dependent RNA helicase SUPV3L1/SUV3